MERIKNTQEKREKIIYTALFVDNITQLKEKYPPIHQNKYYHHSTIAFRPKNGRKNLNIGKKSTIKIIGRVTTGKVDTLLVKNKKSQNKNPHITLSTAKKIKPITSNEEIKKAIENNKVIPIRDNLHVTEGYFNGKTKIID